LVGVVITTQSLLNNPMMIDYQVNSIQKALEQVGLPLNLFIAALKLKTEILNFVF